MSHILKHWREAATLLLVSKTRLPSVTNLQTTNYETLMLKRSGKSKFMPKLHVFPGGVAHDSDFSPTWMELFKQCGEDTMTNLDLFLHRGGKGTHMFSRRRPAEFSVVPSELAFRICAIRETFEESGILLVRDINSLKHSTIEMSSQPLSGKSSILSETILKPWREKVNEDAEEFIKMCESLNILPDVWSLYEWSNWLTPLLPGTPGNLDKNKGRRYDTAFYICMLDNVPIAVHCDKETTELEWASASKFLLKHSNEDDELQLAPPQVVELGRILHFTDVEKLKQFAWERSAVRCQWWFPVTAMCSDGVLFLYPGDSLYPEHPDYYGETERMVIPGTAEELRIKYPQMNRSEMTAGEGGRLQRTFMCNIKMADNQVAPLFEDIVDTVPMPKL